MEEITDGRRSSASNSPEFEFWMIRNPSSQQPTLHSADQLFSGGILLPLQLLNSQNTDDDQPHPSISPDPEGSDLKTTSKRWTDIFRKNPPQHKHKEKKKKERSGGSGTTTAELNINLWPFSRSRSAGNSGSRPRTVVGNRKVSSAPCSRSNSTGDKYRKWGSSPGAGGVYLGRSSPGRGGVHLGRGSPVCQVKGLVQSRSLHDNVGRSSGGRPTKKSSTGAGGNNKVGERQRISCGSDEVTAAVSVGGEGGGGGLFNLRGLFTKKVF